MSEGQLCTEENGWVRSDLAPLPSLTSSRILLLLILTGSNSFSLDKYCLFMEIKAQQYMPIDLGHWATTLM